VTFAQLVTVAWQAVQDNRLRSVLTALGIVIGIAAVIALVTMGASVQASVTDSFGTPSTRTVDVATGVAGQEGFGPGNGPDRAATSLAVFTERDVAAIAALAGVESVAPSTAVPVGSVTVAGRPLALPSLTATTADATALRTLTEGRVFVPGELEAVVDATTASRLGADVGVGDVLRVRLLDGRQLDVTVVGVAAAGEGFASVRSGGSGLYVPVDPFTPATAALPGADDAVRTFTQLAVTAADVDGVAGVQAAMATYLEDASDARTLLPDGQAFAVSTNAEVLDQVNDLLGTLTGFVTGIALIALLVGSIGIANIMLVSVTERTREIGVMKAIGGQSRTILALFLTEAVIHGVLGAVIGTALGLAGGWIGATALDLTATLPWPWIVAAIGIGVAVGITAGLFPASRAARLQPVEALRYE